jgi:pimeloyl-ACP methyl ester carboxylesterase
MATLRQARDTGTLGGLPFVRFGRGTRTLALLPGIEDSLRDVRSRARSLAWLHAPLGRDHVVFVIGRRRSLPAGTTTRDIAGDYAEALEELGRADVVGLSMGSLVAQHLAADAPSRVGRLVLGLAPHRPDRVTRTILDRWIEHARARRWRALYRAMAREVYSGAWAWMAEGALTLLPPFAVPGPEDDGHDFIVSAEACRAHDATERLPAIRVPTLVLGGTRDRLFPRALFRDTARRIPGARLALLEGTGHVGFVEAHRAFHRSLRDFLAS